MELTPEAECWYWHPVVGDRQHAYRGARRWQGEQTGTAVCGAITPMAWPREMDYMLKSCPKCWAILVHEAWPEYNPHRSSDRDREMALEEAQKLSQG